MVRDSWSAGLEPDFLIHLITTTAMMTTATTTTSAVTTPPIRPPLTLPSSSPLSPEDVMFSATVVKRSEAAMSHKSLQHFDAKFAGIYRCFKAVEIRQAFSVKSEAVCHRNTCYVSVFQRAEAGCSLCRKLQGCCWVALDEVLCGWRYCRCAGRCCWHASTTRYGSPVLRVSVSLFSNIYTFAP